QGPFSACQNRVAKSAKSTNEKDRALENRVVHRHACEPHAFEHDDADERVNQQGDQQKKNPADNKCAVRGAAEMCEQERYDQKPIKTSEAIQTLVPPDIRPNHADNDKTPEQDRKAAHR